MSKKVKVKKLRKERHEIRVNYYIRTLSYFIIDAFYFTLKQNLLRFNMYKVDSRVLDDESGRPDVHLGAEQGIDVAIVLRCCGSVAPREPPVIPAL